MDNLPWYHWIWVVPLILISAAVGWVITKLINLKHYVKMRYILWRNPELKELQKLSGVE